MCIAIQIYALLFRNAYFDTITNLVKTTLPVGNEDFDGIELKIKFKVILDGANS